MDNNRDEYSNCKFLDTTSNLMKNTYKTYQKPNDEPLYINKHFNHLVSALRQLPKSISKQISSNEEQVVLRDSGQGFEFPQLNSLLRWSFSWQGKKIKEKQNMIYIFKITIIRNVSQMNMLITIYKHFEHWIMLSYFFYCSCYLQWSSK